VRCRARDVREQTEGYNVRGVTLEQRLLDEHPDVRGRVARMTEFVRWRAALPTVEVDGETFAVFAGDRLLDADQLIVEWVRQFQPELLEGRWA
jgi:hypothetical protein